MKKLFIFSLTTLVLVLIFFVAYNVSFRSVKENSTADVTLETPPIKADEKKENELISALTEEKVFFPQINAEGSRINYFSENGELFSISFTGALRKNSERSAIGGIESLLWSPTREKALILLSSEGTGKYAWYDYENKKLNEYEKAMDYVAWTASDEKIAYKKYDTETSERSLILAEVDGNNERKIASIPWKMVSIAAPKGNNNIFFWNLPTAGVKTQLKKVSTFIVPGRENKDNSEFIGNETEKFGADYLWSNKGDKILVSSVSDEKGSIMETGIINEKGTDYQNLKTPTIASKCVWSNEDIFVYCAVPSMIEPGMVMPDDYLNNKFFTSDIFWKINVQTGERMRLVELEQIKNDYDANNLFLSPAEDALFFVNRRDEKLYRISL